MVVSKITIKFSDHVSARELASEHIRQGYAIVAEKIMGDRRLKIELRK